MKKRPRKKVQRFSGLIAVIVVLGLAALFGPYLTAKVAPGLKFRILGPSTLTPGQPATITWDTSPENARRWPYEKIEYCTGALLRERCHLIAASANNNGKAAVKIPVSLPPGKGVLKFTPRDAQKKLSGSLSSRSGPVTVKATATIARSDSGGSSGGGGGGGGDGDGDGGGSGGGGGGTSNPKSEPAAPTPGPSQPGGGSTPVPPPAGGPIATPSGPWQTGQCRDRVDNDHDGPADYPDDLGCSSPADTTESGQCQDGADNDADGLVDQNDPACQLNPESDENASSVVFLTRAAHAYFFQPNFSAGDLECQREAIAAQLPYPRTFKAILSGRDVNAKDRLRLLSPIKLPNGTLVATSAADLWDGSLRSGIDRYGDGQSIFVAPNGSAVLGTFRVWSGTNAFGVRYSPSGTDPAVQPWCNNWTATSPHPVGIEMGAPGATDGTWISRYGTKPAEQTLPTWNCDNIHQLYCVGPS